MRTIEGNNLMLDAAFSGVAWTGLFYFGLIDGSGAEPVFDAADTMADHPGWTELTTYQGDRLSIAFDPAADGMKAGQTTEFTFTAPSVIAGFFLTTSPTKGGATGALITTVLRSPALNRGPGDTWFVRLTLGLGDRPMDHAA